MALRHLQLLRNSGTTVTRAQAIASATEQAASLKDGEVIVARYLKDVEGGLTSGNTAVALGFKVSGVTVFHDPAGDQEDFEALRQAVGVNKGVSAITIDNAHYASGKTVVSALTQLDEQLYSATTAAANAHSVLGTTTGTTALTVTGTYVSNSSTVKDAVEKLDAAIVVNDTNDDALRQAVGVESGATSLVYPADSVKYLTGATDNVVSGALVTLDSKLYEVSGKVDTNKIVETDTIHVTSATSGTQLDVKVSSTQKAPTASAATYNGNIISATTDGIYAFADLTYTAASNTLEFVNTYGKKSIKLTGVELLDSSTYDSTTEELVLEFHTASGGTDTVRIPMSGLITEFEFTQATDADAIAPITSGTEQHNVYFAEVRGDVAGKTKVYGEVSVFDCGTY